MADLNKTLKIDIELNGQDVLTKGVAQLKTSIQSLNNVDLKLDLDTTKASAKLKDLLTEIKTVDAAVAGLSNHSVSLSVSPAVGELKLLQEWIQAIHTDLNNLSGKPINLDVNTSNARHQVQELIYDIEAVEDRMGRVNGHSGFSNIQQQVKPVEKAFKEVGNQAKELVDIFDNIELGDLWGKEEVEVKAVQKTTQAYEQQAQAIQKVAKASITAAKVKAASRQYDNPLDAVKEVNGGQLGKPSTKGLKLADYLRKEGVSELEIAARMVGQGFIKGVDTVTPEVEAEMKRLAESGIKMPLLNALEIHSPSHWADRKAQDTIQGYINGTKKKQPELAKAMQDIADIVKDNLEQVDRIMGKSSLISGKPIKINNVDEKFGAQPIKIGTSYKNKNNALANSLAQNAPPIAKTLSATASSHIDVPAPAIETAVATLDKVHESSSKVNSAILAILNSLPQTVEEAVSRITESTNELEKIDPAKLDKIMERFTDRREMRPKPVIQREIDQLNPNDWKYQDAPKGEYDSYSSEHVSPQLWPYTSKASLSLRRQSVIKSDRMKREQQGYINRVNRLRLKQVNDAAKVTNSSLRQAETQHAQNITASTRQEVSSHKAQLAITPPAPTQSFLKASDLVKQVDALRDQAYEAKNTSQAVHNLTREQDLLQHAQQLLTQADQKARIASKEAELNLEHRTQAVKEAAEAQKKALENYTNARNPLERIPAKGKLDEATNILKKRTDEQAEAQKFLGKVNERIATLEKRSGNVQRLLGINAGKQSAKSDRDSEKDKNEAVRIARRNAAAHIDNFKIQTKAAPFVETENLKSSRDFMARAEQAKSAAANFASQAKRTGDLTIQNNKLSEAFVQNELAAKLAAEGVKKAEEEYARLGEEVKKAAQDVEAAENFFKNASKEERLAADTQLKEQKAIYARKVAEATKGEQELNRVRQQAAGIGSQGKRISSKLDDNAAASVRETRRQSRENADNARKAANEQKRRDEEKARNIRRNIRAQASASVTSIRASVVRNNPAQEAASAVAKQAANYSNMTRQMVRASGLTSDLAARQQHLSVASANVAKAQELSGLAVEKASKEYEDAQKRTAASVQHVEALAKQLETVPNDQRAKAEAELKIAQAAHAKRIREEQHAATLLRNVQSDQARYSRQAANVDYKIAQARVQSTKKADDSIIKEKDRLQKELKNRAEAERKQQLQIQKDTASYAAEKFVSSLKRGVLMEEKAKKTPVSSYWASVKKKFGIAPKPANFEATTGIAKKQDYATLLTGFKTPAFVQKALGRSNAPQQDRWVTAHQVMVDKFKSQLADAKYSLQEQSKLANQAKAELEQAYKSGSKTKIAEAKRDYKAISKGVGDYEKQVKTIEGRVKSAQNRLTKRLVSLPDAVPVFTYKKMDKRSFVDMLQGTTKAQVYARNMQKAFELSQKKSTKADNAFEAVADHNNKLRQTYNQTELIIGAEQAKLVRAQKEGNKAVAAEAARNIEELRKSLEQQRDILSKSGEREDAFKSVKDSYARQLKEVSKLRDQAFGVAKRTGPSRTQRAYAAAGRVAGQTVTKTTSIVKEVAEKVPVKTAAKVASKITVTGAAEATKKLGTVTAAAGKTSLGLASIAKQKIAPVIDASGLDKFKEKVSQASDAGKELYTKFKVATAGMFVSSGITAASSLKIASGFEQAKADLVATLDPMERTAENYAEIDRVALKVGKDTSFSNKEAADGIAEFAQQGLNLKDSLIAIVPAAKAAEVNHVGLAEAATTGSVAMNSFGLSAKDLAHIFDVQNKAAQLGTIAFNDFQLGIAAGGSTAKMVGQTFEDFSGALVAVTNGGLSAQDAGTSLKTMFMNLVNPTQANADLMDKLNISLSDAKGNFRPVADVIEQTEKALDKMTPAQRAQTLAQLAGSDAMRAYYLLLQTGSVKLREQTKALQDSSAGIGELAKSHAIVRDTLAGQVDNLKGSFEGLANVIGTPMLAPFKEFMARKADSVNALTDWESKTHLIGGSMTKVFQSMFGVEAKSSSLFGQIIKGASQSGPADYNNQLIALRKNALAAGESIAGMPPLLTKSEYAFRRSGQLMHDFYYTYLAASKGMWQSSPNIQPVTRAIGNVTLKTREMTLAWQAGAKGNWQYGASIDPLVNKAGALALTLKKTSDMAKQAQQHLKFPHYSKDLGLPGLGNALKSSDVALVRNNANFIQTAVAKIVGTVNEFKVQIGAVGAGIAAFALVLTKAGPLIGLLTIPLKLALPILTSLLAPINLLIMGIGGLAAILYGAIAPSDAIGTAINGVVTNMRNAGGPIKMLGDFIAGLQERLATAANAVKVFFTSGNGLEKGFNSIGAAVGRFASGALKTLLDGLGIAVHVLAGLASGILGGIVSAFDGFGKGATNAGEKGKGFAISLEAIFKVFSTLGISIGKIIGDIGSVIFHFGEAAVKSGVLATVVLAITNAFKALSNIFDTVKNSVVSTFDSIMGTARTVGGVLAVTFGMIADAINAVRPPLEVLLKAYMIFRISMLQTMVAGIAAIVMGLYEFISVIGSVIGWMGQAATQGGILGAVFTVLSIPFKVFSAILTSLQDPLYFLADIGGKIVGIILLWKGTMMAWTFVTTAAATATEAFNVALGLKASMTAVDTGETTSNTLARIANTAAHWLAVAAGKAAAFATLSYSGIVAGLTAALAGNTGAIEANTIASNNNKIASVASYLAYNTLGGAIKGAQIIFAAFTGQLGSMAGTLNGQIGQLGALGRAIAVATPAAAAFGAAWALNIGNFREVSNQLVTMTQHLFELDNLKVKGAVGDDPNKIVQLGNTLRNYKNEVVATIGANETAADAMRRYNAGIEYQNNNARQLIDIFKNSGQAYGKMITSQSELEAALKRAAPAWDDQMIKTEASRAMLERYGKDTESILGATQRQNAALYGSTAYWEKYSAAYIKASAPTASFDKQISDFNRLGIEAFGASGQISQLSSHVAELKANSDEMQNTLQNQTSSVNSLMQSYYNLSPELQGTVSQYREAINAWIDSKGANQDAAKDVEVLSQKIREASPAYGDLTLKIKSNAEAAVSTGRALADNNENIAAANMEIGKLKDTLDAAKKAGYTQFVPAQYISSLRDLKNQADEAKKALDGTTKAVDDLSKKLSEKEDQASHIDTMVEKLSGRFSGSKDQGTQDALKSYQDAAAAYEKSGGKDFKAQQDLEVARQNLIKAAGMTEDDKKAIDVMNEYVKSRAKLTQEINDDTLKLAQAEQDKKNKQNTYTQANTRLEDQSKVAAAAQFGNATQSFFNFKPATAAASKQLDDAGTDWYAHAQAASKRTGDGVNVGGQSMADNMKDKTAQATQNINTGFSQVNTQPIADNFNNTANQINSSAQGVGTQVAANLNAGYAQANAQPIYDEFGNVVNQLPAQAGAVSNQVASQFNTGWTNVNSQPIADNYSNTMSQMGPATDKGMGSVLGSVENYMGQVNGIIRANDPSATAKWIGEMIGAGMAQGMELSVGQVRAAGIHLSDEAAAAIKAGAKIYSPSRVTMELGGYFSEGFAVGIKEGAPKVTSVLDQSTRSFNDLAAKNAEAGAAAVTDNINKNLSKGADAVDKFNDRVTNNAQTVGDFVNQQTQNAAAQAAAGQTPGKSKKGKGKGKGKKAKAPAAPAKTYGLGDLSKLIGEDLKSAAEQSDNVGKVADGISKMSEAMDKLRSFVPVGDATMDLFAKGVAHMMAKFAQALSGFNAESSKALGDVSDAAGKVADTGSKFVDLFTKLASYSSVAQDSLDAFVGDVSYFISEFGKAASGFDINMLVSAQVFADTAGKAADGIMKMVDGLNKIRNYSNMSYDVMRGFVYDVGFLINEFVIQAGNFEGGMLEGAGVFADTMGKVGDSISKMAEGLSVIRGWAGIAYGQITGFVWTMGFTVNEFAIQAANFAPGMMDAAAKFAETAAKVGEVISKGVEAFTALQSWGGVAYAQVEMFDGSIAVVVFEFGQIAAKLGGMAEDAGKFADDAKKVIDIIAGGIEAFNALAGFRTKLDDRAVQPFADAIRLVIQKIGDVAQQVGNSGKVAGEFSDNAKKVIDIIKPGIDAFKDLARYKADVAGHVDGFMADLKLVFDRFKNAATGLHPAEIGAAKAFADGAGAVIKVFADGVKAFDSLKGFGGAVEGKIKLLIDGLKMALEHLKTLPELTDKEFTQAAKDFGDSVNTLFGGLKTALDVFIGLQDLVDIPEEYVTLLVWGVHVAIQKVMFLPEVVNSDVLNAIKDFGDSINTLFGGLKTALDVFKGLEEFKTIPDQVISALLDNIMLAANKAAAMNTAANTEILGQANQFFAAAQALLEAVKGAMDVFNQMKPLADTPVQVLQFFIDELKVTQNLFTTFLDGTDNLQKSADLYLEKMQKFHATIKKGTEEFLGAKHDMAGGDEQSQANANVNAAGVAGARADGGPVMKGQTYLVGEKGPELFTASTSGRIMSAAQTAPLVSDLPPEFYNSPSGKPIITNPHKPKGDSSGGSGGSGSSQTAEQTLKDLADAVDKLLTDLDKINKYTALAEDKLQLFKTDMNRLVAALWDIAKSYKKDQLELVGAFGDAAQKGAQAMGAMTDAFTKLLDYTRPADSILNQAFADTKHIVQVFRDMSNELFTKIEEVDKPDKFADMAGKVFGALKSAADFFEAMHNYHAPGPQVLDSFMNYVNVIKNKVIQAMGQLNNDTAPVVGQFGDALDKVFKGLDSALTLFPKLLGWSGLQMPDVNVLINQLMFVLASLTARLPSDMVTINKLAAFYDSVDKIFTSFKSALQSLFAIGEATKVPFTAIDGTLNSVQNSLAMMAGLVDASELYKMGAMSFSDNMLEAANAMRAVVQAFANLGTGFTFLGGGSEWAAPPPGKATGGVVGSGPYMVGENGPELFFPGERGGYVMNNAMSNQYMNSASSNDQAEVHIDQVTIVIQGGNDPQAIAREVENILSGKVRRARSTAANNGQQQKY